MSYYDTVKLIVNALLILLTIVFIVWIYKEIHIQKLEKRINQYSISKSSNRHSLFDIIVNFYLNTRKKISNLLNKSSYFKKYSLKYEKYLDKDNIVMKKAMDYVATKFLLAFLFVLVLFVSMVIQNDSITISKIIIAFTLGYFSFDIFLIGKKKVLTYEMQNGLLKAITIMNNSFKSGQSIIKTIEIVKDELDGPLKNEFIKMYNDLAYGLELDVAFKRFNERVNLKDVKYITTSLSILNKTGGNIVLVFDSIEKTVFNNKKLNDELKNLSAASRALYHVLAVIPFVFIFIIFLIDSTYFMPLFTSSFGIILIVFMIILYVLYLFIVKKIIKIKEY